MTGPVTVLIVDDSALVRQMLTSILSSDPGISVVGAAPDPLIARQMIKQLNPQVVTLDVEMPNMDGLSFLDKIMRLRPMPVVMVSTLTQRGADITLQALEMGAVDFVAKPTLDVRHGLEEAAAELIAKIKGAAQAKVRARSDQAAGGSRPLPGPGYLSSEKIVAIGASTGGVEAITEILRGFPADCPATVITQHMPGHFTANFARRLDMQVAPAVSEASDGARLLPGHVYIAPGDHHLNVERSGANYLSRLHRGPTVSGHRPSVDEMFRSVAVSAGANAVGVILTGMGRDGGEGLLAMRKAGAATIGQNEASCVVYGMPRVAFELGGVQAQHSLCQISAELLRHCRASGATNRI